MKIDEIMLRVIHDKIIKMNYEIGKIVNTVLQEEAISSILYKNRRLALELADELDELWKESIK